MKSRTIFLIQLSLWLSVILTCGIPAAQAAMSSNQEIQAVQSLEDTLFAVHYDQDALNDRVNRLEETVFGQAQSGTSLEARITKLQGSLSPKALGPLSPMAKNANNTQTQSNAGNNNINKGNGPISNPTQQRNAPMATNSNTTPQQIASNSGTSTSSAGRFNRQSAVKPANSPAPSTANGANGSVNASPEPGETDYPTVSQMELKLFSKTFPKEDITQRLARLEKQVFKMPQTGSLADRTDNLRMVVLGDVGQGQPVANGYQSDPQDPGNSNYGYPQPPNYGGYSGYNGMGGSPASGYGGGYPYGNSAYGTPGNYPSNTIASAGPTTGGMNPMPGYGRPVNTAYQPKDSTNATTPDMLAAMNEVEKEVLGTTYPSEPINTRLDRLENKVFKTTSPDMNPQDRMQRVIAVASAGGAPMNNKAKVKSTLQVLLPIILTILPLVLL